MEQPQTRDDPPLRVLLVRPTLGQGGADAVTLTLLRELPRARYDLELALMRPEGELLGGVPADVPVAVLRSRSLWTAWLALWRRLRADPPDVVFSTSSGTNMPAALAWLLARRPGRLVLSERSILLNAGATPKRRLQVAIKRLFYRHASCMTCVSQGVARDLVEHCGVDASTVRVVYNPIVTDALLARAQELCPHPWFEDDGPPVVLAAGRLVAQKDHASLLEAVALLRRRGLAARLVILGEGPLRATLEARIEALGLAAVVDLPGYEERVPSFMARCAVFVLSSANEGLPGALIQAMACGAPCVSTMCPVGPDEIIECPGEQGLLVPVGDVDALANAIEKLLTDSSLRSRIAAQAPGAVERFTVAASLERYMAAIDGREARELNATGAARPLPRPSPQLSGRQ